METTATVNIELNGKPVSNKLQELRKQALELANAFYKAEKAGDFEKSKKYLASIQSLIEYIQNEKEIVNQLGDAFQETEKDSNGFFMNLKQRFLSLFNSDEVEQNASELAENFANALDDELRKSEVENKLADFLKTLKEAYSKAVNDPNQYNLLKVRNLLKETLNYVNGFERSFLDNFEEINREINLLITNYNKNLLNKTKLNYKDSKEQETAGYYKELTRIQQSEIKESEKKLAILNANLDHAKNQLMILELSGVKTGKERERLIYNIAKIEQQINDSQSKQATRLERIQKRNQTRLSAINSRKQSELEVYDKFYSKLIDENQLKQKLNQIRVDYYKTILSGLKEGTKEYNQYLRYLSKAETIQIVEERKQLEENLTAWLYIYSQQGAKERMDAELAVVDELLKQELLKTEEAEEAKAAIHKKYRDQVNTKTGSKAPNQDFDDAADNYKLQIKALADAHAQGLIEHEDYESRKWQITQNYHSKVVELIRGQGSEWATMVTNLVESWKAGFDNLGSTTAEKMQTISAMAASAFAIMSQGLQAYTQYANASRDLEVAHVEASYDKQIKAAGNNDKKKKKLEEQKEKEIAKIKNKYNKRAMAIELAQAIASTAMAAINAYASAAQVPGIGYILAPIAASMATAAGMMQIAAIRKQHQAQEQGYYEGGFTRRDGNSHRQAGIVHANEFVANHQAVANPDLLPVLRLIDHAQRNNTVGSLTRDDVSRAIGQGTILADITAGQHRTAQQHDTSMVMVAASMERQAAAIEELNDRLAHGIESFMVLDGERGFERSWQHYQRMKANPRR